VTLLVKKPWKELTISTVVVVVVVVVVFILKISLKNIIITCVLDQKCVILMTSDKV